MDYQGNPPKPFGFPIGLTVDGNMPGQDTSIHRLYSATRGINLGYLEAAIGIVSSMAVTLNEKLEQLRHAGSSLSVADMMTLQYDSNRLNQLVEAVSTLSKMLKDLASSITRNI